MKARIFWYVTAVFLLPFAFIELLFLGIDWLSEACDRLHRRYHNIIDPLFKIREEYCRKLHCGRKK